MNNNNVVVFGLLVFSALFGGCQGGPGGKDPKDALNRYISQSFAIKKPEDRQRLLSFLTGDAKKRLTAWSDEQFRVAFMDSKRSFVSLKFDEMKKISDSEFHITYQLAYLDQERGAGAKVTSKKICQLVRENDQWLIRDVRNVKELVEYRNEMAVSPQ